MERNLWQYGEDHGGISDEREIYKDDNQKFDLFEKEKEEIKRQLESDIGEALNTGEKVEDVISRMGEADEITKAFNQSFSEEEKKAIP